MNKIDIILATAFANAVPGVEDTQQKLPGYSGTQSHVLLPRINPAYRFDKERFLTLSYSWAREWSRTETDPRRGVWFGGPKGAGKTTVVEQFFARLGVPVLTLTCNRRIPLSDFIQKMVPDGEGGWLKVDGALTTAMRMGYPVVLSEPSAMDEADLIAMHDIIDRGYLVMEDGDVVQAKRGFLVYATDNTMGWGDQTGAYGGTGSMNSATMRRFLKDEVDYPSPEEEIEILQRYFPGQTQDVLRQFVDFANAIRAPHRAGQSPVTMGTGEVREWVECAQYFRTLAHRKENALNPAWFAFKRIMGGIPGPELQAARQHFQNTFQVDVTGQ